MRSAHKIFSGVCRLFIRHSSFVIRHPAAALATALITWHHAAAADWPQFLGPNRDGVADESEAAITTSFPSSGPKILWRAKLGTGFAGPAVADGKVIVFHRTGDKAVVQALDATTGKEVWSFSAVTDYTDSFGFDNGPRATPTIAGGKVIVHGADGLVHALDLKTGAKLWRYDTVKELKSPQGFFGRSCAPLVVGRNVIITAGGSNDKGAAGVVALKLDDGTPAWQAVDDEASYSSPIVRGDTLVCWLRNQIVVCDSETGIIQFQQHHRSDMDASVNAATPIWCGADSLFTSACYGVGGSLWKMSVTRVPKHSPQVELKQVWTGEGSLDCHYGTPVYYDKHLYGFHGRQEQGQTLRCILAADGKLRWESPRVRGGGIIRVKDTLVLVTEDGELWLVAASPDKFNQLAAAQILRAGHRSFPAFANGILYARDGKELVAVDLRSR
ncbi:MAG TPA: PQQ-binding-like beta-propeller repeat protein [Verrucomicrobiaceae bacterium]|jgi:outer membrane protein assembly factor BamB